ncbi:MAG: nucleoside-diphosphate kinase [Deltaproteobacteria bacterium]|nr:nucleoside-diphosphate kinase [Deltaproteobacteria bacterium]
MTAPNQSKTRTLAIIKPDATERNLTGKIIEKIQSAGFQIIGMKLIRLTRGEAEGFYFVHKGKSFFRELCDFMSRNPIVVMALESEQSVPKWRKLMGATNPALAEPGTIRKELGTSIQENVVHGSDGPETAKVEIRFFFPDL